MGLDPARFWRQAFCPVCRTAVDPLRLRRGWWWLTGQAPWSRLRLGRAIVTPLDGLVLLWTAGVVAVALMLWVAGDRLWPGTLLLYAGRWIWLVPAGPLLVLALLARRPATIGLAVVPALIALFPIMGLSLGLARLGLDPPGSTPIRLVTYNVAGGERVAGRFPELLAVARPDLVAIQECGATLREVLAGTPGYTFHAAGPACLLSRLPIVSAAVLPRKAVEGVGGSGIVVRYRLEGPAGPFDLTNVHLMTPRRGFEELLEADVGGVAEIRRGIVLRDIESRQARRWVEEGAGPRLVTGDFNLPLESRIFRDHWSDLTEAFARAGRGFGSTRINGWIRLRIDHVLSDERWIVRSAEVLPDYGSDHLPLLAELELRR